MDKKILFKERKILKNLKFLSEQTEDMYKISPDEIYELLKFASDNLRVVTRLPKFQGKKLYVTGPLSLSGKKDIDSLGNIGYVDGTLDISRTNISSLGDVVVKGYVWDGGTPIERKRLARELAAKKAIASERAENDEWNINNPDIDDLGIKANVLYRYLIEEGEVNEPSEEELEEIKQIELQIQELETKANDGDNSEYDEIYDKISELEDRLEEIKPKISVYDIYPTKYSHYGLTNFEILDPDFKNQEYTVGDDDEMEEAVKEYSENYINDVGLEGFNQSFLEDYVDKEEIEYYVRDFYERDVYDNPDVYFNDDDYELSSEQEERKEQLENYISEMEDRKMELQDEQSDLESEIEDPDEYSTKYDEIEEKIDEVNANIETAQNEIDEIEENKKEVTDDMVEQVVKSRVDDALYDPISFMKEWGLDINNFIDKEALAQGLADTDGWGVMNSYNGNYEAINSVGDETYYVMRIN